jgi:hypothetical protein
LQLTALNVGAVVSKSVVRTTVVLLIQYTHEHLIFKQWLVIVHNRGWQEIKLCEQGDSVVRCLHTANARQGSHFWESSTFSVSKKCPNPKFHYRVYKSRPLFPFLIQTNKSNNRSYWFKICLNISSHLLLGLPESFLLLNMATKFIHNLLKIIWIFNSCYWEEGSRT